MRVTMHHRCWWLIYKFLALPLSVASRQRLDRSWPHGLDGWWNAPKHMKHGCDCVVEVLNIVLWPNDVCLVWYNGPNVVRCRSQLKLRCNVSYWKYLQSERIRAKAAEWYLACAIMYWFLLSTKIRLTLLFLFFFSPFFSFFSLERSTQNVGFTASLISLMIVIAARQTMISLSCWLCPDQLWQVHHLLLSRLADADQLICHGRKRGGVGCGPVRCLTSIIRRGGRGESNRGGDRIVSPYVLDRAL